MLLLATRGRSYPIPCHLEKVVAQFGIVGHLSQPHTFACRSHTDIVLRGIRHRAPRKKPRTAPRPRCNWSGSRRTLPLHTPDITPENYYRLNLLLQAPRARRPIKKIDCGAITFGIRPPGGRILPPMQTSGAPSLDVRFGR